MVFSNMWRLVVAVVLIALFFGGTVHAAPKAPRAAEVAVAKIHIIQGCGVCEAMMEWLKQGGVKLKVKQVARPEYSTYPTVLYSDGFFDHGDRMYRRQAGIPKEIDILSCE